MRLAACSLYLLSSFTFGDFYTLGSTGAVADTLHYNSGDIVKTYLNPEPRLALSYAFTPSASIKASYVRNVQNLHLISSATTSRPTDKWVASTNNIKPEIAAMPGRTERTTSLLWVPIS